MSFFAKKSPGFSFFSSNKKSTGSLFSGLPPTPSKEEEYLNNETSDEKNSDQQEKMCPEANSTMAPAPKPSPPSTPLPKAPSVATSKRLPKLPSLSFNMFQRKGKDTKGPGVDAPPQGHASQQPIQTDNNIEQQSPMQTSDSEYATQLVAGSLEEVDKDKGRIKNTTDDEHQTRVNENDQTVPVKVGDSKDVEESRGGVYSTLPNASEALDADTNTSFHTENTTMPCTSMHTDSVHTDDDMEFTTLDLQYEQLRSRRDDLLARCRALKHRVSMDTSKVLANDHMMDVYDSTAELGRKLAALKRKFRTWHAGSSESQANDHLYAVVKPNEDSCDDVMVDEAQCQNH